MASRGATPSARRRVALLAAFVLALLAGGFSLRAFHALTVPGPRPLPGRAFELAVYLVVGAFASGFAIALGASSLAVAPLDDLTRTAHAMRRDLGLRSGVRGADEIGQLGEALDNLAAWLATEKLSLEQDRDRLATILESMREGVLVTGEAGVIVLANSAVREMLLVDRSVVGRTPLEAVRVDGLEELLERAAASPEGAGGELDLGGLRPRRLLVHGAPLRAPKGAESPGLVVVLSDVTELRRLETVRRDFVANVSHELRTPITAIRAASETLSAGAIDDPTAARDFVGIVARNAERLGRLVEDLLALSKIEARKWQLTIEAVSVQGAALAAAETVATAARERGAAVHVDIAADLVAKADRHALEHVLVNLVDNAVKYGGPSRRVEVRAARAGDRVRIEVQDFGPGIEPRHIPRLFERFYRVDAGRSRAVGGTGLGLSIVKHLVEAMEGHVQVRTILGKGTTFLVELPPEDAAVERDAT